MMNRTFHTQGGDEEQDNIEVAGEKEESGTATMQRQLKVDKIYQGFRQGKSQRLSKTLQKPNEMQSRVAGNMGDHVERSVNLGVHRLSKQTQQRI